MPTKTQEKTVPVAIADDVYIIGLMTVRNECNKTQYFLEYCV